MTERTWLAASFVAVLMLVVCTGPTCENGVIDDVMPGPGDPAVSEGDEPVGGGGGPISVTVTDMTPTAPLSNPTPSGFQPRYISGFGSGDSFTVFFEDRDAGSQISYVSTTTGLAGLPASATATNISDTHFCVKDWPINIGGTDYAYRAWASVGNDQNHHFYVSNDLSNWTLVSTFTISNAAGFTGARGWVYYGFHDVVLLNGTYYAWAESNQGQTMVCRSTNGDDTWEAFASVGGTQAADGPLQMPESATPSGAFIELGGDRGYGKIMVRGNDSGFYLAMNTVAQPSLGAAAVEAAFIDPNNWSWHDGLTGLPASPILEATAERDLRECWLVSSGGVAEWNIIYDADYGMADGGKALGYATLSAPLPAATEVWVDDDFDASTLGWGYTHFATIQNGVNGVAPGGTVHIAAGTYEESIDLGNGGDFVGINFIGAGSADVLWRAPVGQNCLRRRNSGNNETMVMEISGITFAGDASGLVYIGKTRYGNESLPDCELDIHDNVFLNEGPVTNANYGLYMCKNTVDRNPDGSARVRIYNNTFKTLSGLLMSNCTNFEVFDNDFTYDVVGAGVADVKNTTIYLGDGCGETYPSVRGGHHFHGNSFAHVGDGYVEAIQAGGSPSGYATVEDYTADPRAAITDLCGGQTTVSYLPNLVENNTFACTNGGGISFGSYGTAAWSYDSVNINGETISEPTVRNNSFGPHIKVLVSSGADPVAAPTVNASGNYLGSTAPADVVSGPVDYSPFLAGDTDADPGTPGFQGDFSDLYATAAGEQTDSAGRITEAVNAVTDGGTVHVTAGTYTEAVVITKSVTVRGATAWVNKNGYTVPAGYAWDDTVESIINHPDPGTGYTAIVDICDANDVTFEGFVVQELNAVANKNTSLVRVFAHTQAISGIVVRNNIIGPNTNTSSQDGAQGRMGLYIVNHPYGDNGVMNSTFAGNKIFGCEGNGNNVFLWSSYYAYGAPGPASMAGTVIEDNEIYGSHRSGIETAGGFSDLVIRGNSIYGNSALPTDNPNLLKYGHGILLVRGASDKMGGATTAYGPVNLTIEDNHIYGNEKSGIYMGPKNTNITMTGNVIHDNGWDGVMLDLEGNYWNPQYESPPASGQYAVYDGSTNVSANNNSIAGNGLYGVRVEGTPTNGFVFDAEDNWWGNASGPSGEGPGTGDAVSAYVDYDPWSESPTADNSLYLDPTPDSLYVQPGEVVTIHMDVANLLQKVNACQALLGYSSTYFEDPSGGSVEAGGGAWDQVIYNSWAFGTGVPEEIDTAIGVNAQGAVGTDADGTVASITLTSKTGVEGTTQMVFRPDVPGDETQVTVLSDLNAQPVWPSKSDSQTIVIDGTDPAVTGLTATQDQGSGAVDVLNCANTTLQGTVSITVDASDALAGLEGVPTIDVSGPETLTATLVDGDEPVFGWEVEIESTTANGTYTITITATDKAGNDTVVTGTLCVNKNLVSGTVAFDTNKSSGYGPFDRDVVFKATDGSGTVLKTWTVTVSFTNAAETASGTYSLTDVPDGIAGLSAKTAWSLREKVSVSPDGDGQATADFTGADILRGGDLNGSNAINVLDYSILTVNFGTVNAVADINGDGGVGSTDYSLLTEYWFETGDEE